MSATVPAIVSAPLSELLPLGNDASFTLRSSSLLTRRPLSLRLMVRVVVARSPSPSRMV
ncbi:hypothetical protein D3C85_1935960 [compost metagenome]